ncbi:MAG: hypothetical protein JWN04_6422 [Myxococcaceae bacterium]|nr:hypothetical protein [Myxococcaceae bacterium]
MFIGHYGVSLAAKRIAPEVSLGSLFIAVQALDILFGSFVLAGVEHMRIVPGFTQYNPYDLYDVTVSHSLVAALLWSSLAAVGYFFRASWRAAAVVGGAVFSHFLLDLPMHTPDLPIARGSGPKLGLGLWNHPVAAVLAELLAFGVGALLYARFVPRVTTRLRWFFVAMFVLTVGTSLFPTPPSPAAFAVQALVAYVALAYYAAWVERSASGQTQHET